MKRSIIGICCLILCFMLVACGSHFSNIASSNYSNFTANGEDDKYELSGKARVVNALHLVYISALNDTNVDLSGELKSMSGDVQIVYINPDNKETVISDSNKDSQKGKLKLNTTINLEKGKSRIEFRGTESTFKFDLLFANIDKNNVEYFTADTEHDEFDEENSEDEDIESLNSKDKNIHNGDDDKLLKDISVTYTDKDDNCTILDTSLNQDTKIKVLVDASVINIDDKDNLSFDGFDLAYKTEDDNTINVLKYKANEFAMGGYEWQDSFVQELDLPKGTNELVFKSYKGTNYEIKLNVQVFKID